MDITWFKKERVTVRSGADVSISVGKSTATIRLRNGFLNEISPETSHIIFGVSNEDKNVLVFMAASKRDGWKFFTSSTEKDGVYKTVISTENVRAMLARFAGDYSMELLDENGRCHYCINRRNVL